MVIFPNPISSVGGDFVDEYKNLNSTPLLTASIDIFHYTSRFLQPTNQPQPALVHYSVHEDPEAPTTRQMLSQFILLVLPPF